MLFQDYLFSYDFNIGKHNANKLAFQLAFASKSTMETSDQCVKFVQI